MSLHIALLRLFLEGRKVELDFCNEPSGTKASSAILSLNRCTVKDERSTAVRHHVVVYTTNDMFAAMIKEYCLTLGDLNLFTSTYRTPLDIYKFVAFNDKS